MLDFLRRNRVLLASALFLILAAGLVLGGAGGRTRSDSLGRIFLEIMAPLLRVGAVVSHTLGGVWDSGAALLRAHDDADTLRTRVRELEEATAQLAEAEQEN